VVPRNQSRLIREVLLSDRSASANFRSTGSAMPGDFLMEELYSFVGEGREQEDDNTLVTAGCIVTDLPTDRRTLGRSGRPFIETAHVHHANAGHVH
jgi:hypothetical protein